MRFLATLTVLILALASVAPAQRSKDKGSPYADDMAFALDEMKNHLLDAIKRLSRSCLTRHRNTA